LKKREEVTVKKTRWSRNPLLPRRGTPEQNTHLSESKAQTISAQKKTDERGERSEKGKKVPPMGKGVKEGFPRKR